MGRIVAETTLLFTLCFLLYGTVAFAFTTTKKTPTLLPYSNQQHQQVHASKYCNSPPLSIGLHSQRVRSPLALIQTRFSHFPLTIQKSVASDDNSNNDSANAKDHSLPSLVSRTRNDRNSSSEDSDSDVEDSKSDSEIDK